ncbi:MAG: hypothetical protein KAR20_24705, partial [Candidatus Heimdallarchaeota archaeon]|nr:hypothetical protein [Candidatus Heimdallarchaeota archaeon]
IMLASLAIVLFVSIALADEVFTENGERYKGTIIEEDEVSVTIKTNEGTMFINRNDIIHIEKEKIQEEKDEFSTTCIVREKVKSSVDFLKKIPQNNWCIVRNLFYSMHCKLFVFLEKQTMYQYISSSQGSRNLRRENYKAYFFAVYMVLMIILAVVFSIVQSIVKSAVCKIFGIKMRYDV